MSIDLLGPTAGAGGVTVRPAESRDFGATDTWFNPCSSQSSRDGTVLQAVFLNAILDQVRYALRASSIDLDNDDSSMLWQAMQAAASGLPFGVASGSAGTLTVSATVPALKLPYREGEVVLVGFPDDLANGSNATIALGGGDRGPLLRGDLSAVRAGDCPGGSLRMIGYRNGRWRLMAPGEVEYPKILGTSTIYVATDGNDANDGRTAASALQTIAAALDRATTYYLLGKPLTIQLAKTGTYPFSSDYPALSGSVIIRGDPANQGAYILTGSGAVTSGRGGIIEADGFTLSLAGLTVRNLSTDRFTLAASGGGRISMINVTVTSTQPLTVVPVYATGAGSEIQINTGCIWDGPAPGYSAVGMMSVRKGEISISTNAALAVANSPSWTNAAAIPIDFGTINVRGGATITGAATGKRYNIASPAVIRADGRGQNFFPGDQAGTIPEVVGRYYA